MEHSYLLFDLDGTLTDPAEGITNSVCYALKKCGIESEPAKELRFIGPPLHKSFQMFYGMSEDESFRAVEYYREYYRPAGIFENRLYDGIPEILDRLKRKGYELAVASSKPEVFVNQILEHFGIADRFEQVVGSELDGRRTDKAEVIREALARLEAVPDDCCMIGDRLHDIEGAHKVGMLAAGVTWGYGSEEELKSAKADVIVRSLEELVKLF